MNPDEFAKYAKVELHLHLDCSLGFEAVKKLDPSVTSEAFERGFRGPEKCIDLADFLTRPARMIALMQTPQALRLVVDDLFDQLAEDNVMYAEIRFAPLLHTEKGMKPNQIVETVCGQISDNITRTGIKAGLILCTLRHYSQEDGLVTAQLAHEFSGHGVVGFDLAADEANFPIQPHIAGFTWARQMNLHRTAHAGEALGADSVQETLSLLQPQRIGHGVRCIENPSLIEFLAKNKVHLEVCPSCNIQIDVFDRYENHPIDRLLRAGVSVGINTDTRTITNINLNAEYARLNQVFGWGISEFYTCNRSALVAAFLPETEKSTLLADLEARYHALGL